MLALALLAEETQGSGLTWLIWMVLLLFMLMVFLGWWVSTRQHTDEEELHLPEGASFHAAHGDSHDDPMHQAEPAGHAEDDLKRIEGIGPKVEKVLKASGISTFAALAGSDAAKVKETLNAAGLQMMSPEGWIEQAKYAARGDMEGMAKLQDELKGGRLPQ